MRNKALLRVVAIAITAVMCTLIILSAVFPFPEGTQWHFLSIGTDQKVLANPDWLSGWSYRKSHNLTGATGAGTGYPIKLKVTDSWNEQIQYEGAVKYGSNPVLEPSVSGWDDNKITDFVFMVDDDGNAVQEDGNYILYYSGDDGTNAKVGRATSSDGYTWTKYGSNPVLSVGGVDDFDEVHVVVAGVIKHGTSDYEMFYVGVDSSGNSEGKLGRATSTDGLSWSKDTVNNPLVDKTTWTNVGAAGFRVPHVILASNDNYYFFFEAYETTDAGHFKIWAGSSADGISWSALNSGAPVFEQAPSGWDSADVANPRVVEIEAGKYLLGYNGNDNSPAANMYELGFATSTDLVNWTRRSENPIVKLGSGGSWDDYRIECFYILKQDIGTEKLRFWYYGCPDNAKTNASIGYGWIPQNVLYVDGHCTDFPNDIRFTDNDGETELDHWCEDLTADPAVFWLEVKDSLESGTVPIYAYCGKSGASSASNGANTFITFDDFERGNDGDEVGGDWTEAQGTVEISTGQAYQGTRSMKLVGTATLPKAEISQTAGEDYAIRWRAYKEDAARFTFYHGDADYLIQIFAETDEKIYYYDGASRDTGVTATPDDWDLYEINNIDWTAHTFDIWHNGILIKEGATMRHTALADIIQLVGLNQAGKDTWIDNFIIRKFTDPEPTHGAWGEWETLSAEITNTPDSNNFGILEVNTTSNTAINYFTIENTGNCAVDVVIYGTDATGGDDTWTLSDTATPGENIYGLKAGLDDEDDTFDVIVRKTETYNTLMSNLAEDATQDWGLKIYMPTSLSGYDAQQMSATITLVASESS